MPTLTTDYRQDIRAALLQVINDDVPANDTDLLDTGLIDSLALVNLIMELENRFQVVIDFDALELDSFRTVDGINTFIASLKQ